MYWHGKTTTQTPPNQPAKKTPNPYLVLFEYLESIFIYFTLIHLIMKETGLMEKFCIKWQTIFDADKINTETTQIIISASVAEWWVGDE